MWCLTSRESLDVLAADSVGRPRRGNFNFRQLPFGSRVVSRQVMRRFFQPPKPSLVLGFNSAFQQDTLSVLLHLTQLNEFLVGATS